MADSRMAECAIRNHVPEGFAIESMEAYGENPMAFEWKGDCPDGRRLWGIVLLHTQGEYAVGILLEHDPKNPYDNGFSLSRQWTYGRISQ